LAFGQFSGRLLILIFDAAEDLLFRFLTHWW
jgi:hypothetical protein